MDKLAKARRRVAMMEKVIEAANLLYEAQSLAATETRSEREFLGLAADASSNLLKEFE